VRVPADEPEAGPWQVVPLAALLELVVTAAGPVRDRPRIVAVDGRGAVQTMSSVCTTADLRVLARQQP
jgi:hypothetical protein